MSELIEDLSGGHFGQLQIYMNTFVTIYQKSYKHAYKISS
jgi:hypothetical protein